MVLNCSSDYLKTEATSWIFLISDSFSEIQAFEPVNCNSLLSPGEYRCQKSILSVTSITIYTLKTCKIHGLFFSQVLRYYKTHKECKLWPSGHNFYRFSHFHDIKLRFSGLFVSGRCIRVRPEEPSDSVRALFLWLKISAHKNFNHDTCGNELDASEQKH